MVKSVLRFIKTTVVVVTEVSDNPCKYRRVFGVNWVHLLKKKTLSSVSEK